MKGMVVVPIVLLVACGLLEAPPVHDAWLEPSWRLPLGSDEFGRNALLVLLVATGRSTAFGGHLAVATISFATAIAYISTFRTFRVLAYAIRLSVQVVESVPIFVWVLAGFAAYRTSSTFVVPVAFMLAVLPIAIAVMRGEFERLATAHYIEAAQLAGVSDLRLIAKHYLPNSWSVIGPLAIQLLGTAIAIRGAIGVLGFSTRSDYDLGISLLRGKENIAAHPMLMTTTILTIVLLYVYLDAVSRRLAVGGVENEGRQQPVQASPSPPGPA